MCVLVALLLGVSLMASACGSSGSSKDSGGAADTHAEARVTQSRDGGGSIKLVVNGKNVDAGTPVDCNVNDYEGEPVFEFGGSEGTIDTALGVRLRGGPGTIGQRKANVILPAPSDSDSYKPTLDVTGSWSRAGDKATGHLEGTAELMSSMTADNPPAPSTFTLDFSCTVTELHLSDLPG